MRKEKPKVTYLVALVMAFLVAEIENRRPEDLPQAYSGRVPERFLLSLRTKSINENFVNWKLRPLLFFVIMMQRIFYSGIIDSFIFISLGFSCQQSATVFIWETQHYLSYKVRSLVSCVYSWASELNARREIPYLGAFVYYSLYNSILASITYLNEISNFEGFIQNVGSVETLQKPELLLIDLSYLYSQYSALKRYQFTVAFTAKGKIELWFYSCTFTLILNQS